MRDFLDAILSFIGATSLTDDEFNALTIVSAAYNSETYEALAAVLDSRESISDLQAKLVSFFEAKGVTVSPYDTGKSNIYIGSVL